MISSVTQGNQAGRSSKLSSAVRSAFVTLGEVMVRDTPADLERPERTRHVYLSMAGSEYSVAVGLARLGIPSAYVTRVPDNPYGRAARNIAREHNVNTDWFVFAPATDLMGRMICELGHTPRPDTVVYQRKYSAASQLDAGMVNWQAALAGARVLHTTGITLGLAAHSGYARNYLALAFQEACAHKPNGCLVGLDWNYRSTLWSLEEARRVLTPILAEQVDILITSAYDMARFYGLDCGQYSAQQVLAGEPIAFADDDLRSLAEQIQTRFDVQVVGFTLRHADSYEQQHWESAAATRSGGFYRSARPQPFAVVDRLGGGDAWTAGFYFGLLTAGTGKSGIEEGVKVGDACARLKQTLMFDLPIVDHDQVMALLNEDKTPSAVRISR